MKSLVVHAASVTVTLDNHEQYEAEDGRQHRFMVRTVHYVVGMERPNMSVSISGPAIRGDGTVGHLVRHTTVRLINLPPLVIATVERAVEEMRRPTMLRTRL